LSFRSAAEGSAFVPRLVTLSAEDHSAFATRLVILSKAKDPLLYFKGLAQERSNEAVILSGARSAESKDPCISHSLFLLSFPKGIRVVLPPAMTKALALG
jgi:hypothetical protein